MDYLATEDRLKALGETLKQLEQAARDGVKLAVEAIAQEQIALVREKIQQLN
jgi:hypothetical protein